MQIDLFTLFPESFDWFSGQRHVCNAKESGGVELRTFNPRDYTELSGRQVDDNPFGGGAGMLLRVDVYDRALSSVYGCDSTEVKEQRRVVALAPTGRRLTDSLVDELVEAPALTLLAGRYEGFDQRIVDHFCSDVISIGDYVLAGGELPCMVLCDAIIRKLPGALGHQDSAVEESFSQSLDGLPEYPHYTRPAEYRGWQVPPVLLSGNHADIAKWRREQSERRAEDQAI